MKVLGIVLLVFATLNFIVAIMALSSGASDAAGHKLSASFLLAVIGGLLFYFSKQKENKKAEEERLAKKRKEDEEKRQALLADQKRKEAEYQQKILEQKEKEQRKKNEVTANANKYKILHFYLDCSHCHEQENKIKKSPLALPVEIIDVDEESDIVEKYKVRNLPKLILVDYNGKEIKRWMGVTEISEINDFLYENGYAERKQSNRQVANSFLSEYDVDDCEDYPKPMFSLGPNDMAKLMSEEYMDKCLSIAAEGGTKEQTQVKFEILLGKREKTEAMIAVEKPIREFFHTLYDTVGRNAYQSSDNVLLRKLAVTTSLLDAYKAANEEDGQHYEAKVKMIEIANKFGVSVNIIESEEKQKATEKYFK